MDMRRRGVLGRIARRRPMALAALLAVGALAGCASTSTNPGAAYQAAQPVATRASAAQATPAASSLAGLPASGVLGTALSTMKAAVSVHADVREMQQSRIAVYSDDPAGGTDRVLWLPGGSGRAAGQPLDFLPPWRHRLPAADVRRDTRRASRSAGAHRPAHDQGAGHGGWPVRRRRTRHRTCQRRCACGLQGNALRGGRRTRAASELPARPHWQPRFRGLVPPLGRAVAPYRAVAGDPGHLDLALTALVRPGPCFVCSSGGGYNPPGTAIYSHPPRLWLTTS